MFAGDRGGDRSAGVDVLLDRVGHLAERADAREYESSLSTGSSTGVADTHAAVVPSVAATIVHPSPQRRLAVSGPVEWRSVSSTTHGDGIECHEGPSGLDLRFG